MRRVGPAPTPTGSSRLDLAELFERTVVDLAKPYARRGRWTPEEADAVVRELCEEFAPCCQELYDLAWQALMDAHRCLAAYDSLHALAAQERTRRDLRLSIR